MCLKAPVRGAVHAGGGESGEAKLAPAGGYVLCNSLEVVKALYVVCGVACLGKELFVVDKTIGFDNVCDAVNSVTLNKGKVVTL